MNTFSVRDICTYLPINNNRAGLLTFFMCSHNPLSFIYTYNNYQIGIIIIGIGTVNQTHL